MTSLPSQDPEVYKALQQELKRQQDTINLIPSENYVSQAVLEAQSSVVGNKYAEGYPNKRYYQGNEYVDTVEDIAITRAMKLFGAEHANVQPYSGSPANQAVYLAFLKPGDTVLGLDLSCGGHLTHGSPVNFSGRTYHAVTYKVNPRTHRIDMEEVRVLAHQHKPKLIISGLTAYPRQIDFQAFQDIAQEVGAIHLADISHISGLVASGLHPSPFPFTDVVMTTTHKTLRGPRGGLLMCKEQHSSLIDKAVFPGLQGGPHEQQIAAKAVAFGEALKPEFKKYCEQIVKNAKALAETLIAQGVPLTTGGTDNHLMVLDLRKFGDNLGKPVAIALEEAGIITNYNTVPFDPAPPFKPSGLRIGTPMVTSRGMGENEMRLIGHWIAQVVKSPQDAALKAKIREDVRGLCLKFPVYPDREY